MIPRNVQLFRQVVVWSSPMSRTEIKKAIQYKLMEAGEVYHLDQDLLRQTSDSDR